MNEIGTIILGLLALFLVFKSSRSDKRLQDKYKEEIKDQVTHLKTIKEIQLHQDKIKEGIQQVDEIKNEILDAPNMAVLTKLRLKAKQVLKSTFGTDSNGSIRKP